MEHGTWNMEHGTWNMDMDMDIHGHGTWTWNMDMDMDMRQPQLLRAESSSGSSHGAAYPDVGELEERGGEGVARHRVRPRRHVRLPVRLRARGRVHQRVDFDLSLRDQVGEVDVAAARERARGALVVGGAALR
eukprot:7215943-Prymnesium_polylepis.1